MPEGATPKDGPSAGVAMVTSIVSVLTGIPVKRDIAMTGEITLRGRVLPIGGLKEKLLAALRGGLKTVLIPAENEKDLAEIPDNVKRGLKIIPVRTVDEVLGHALAEPLTPIEWEDEADGRSGHSRARAKSGRDWSRIDASSPQPVGRTGEPGRPRKGAVMPGKSRSRSGAVALTRSGPALYTPRRIIDAQPLHTRSGGNT